MVPVVLGLIVDGQHDDARAAVDVLLRRARVVDKRAVRIDDHGGTPARRKRDRVQRRSLLVDRATRRITGVRRRPGRRVERVQHVMLFVDQYQRPVRAVGHQGDRVARPRPCGASNGKHDQCSRGRSVGCLGRGEHAPAPVRLERFQVDVVVCNTAARQSLLARAPGCVGGAILVHGEPHGIMRARLVAPHNAHLVPAERDQR